MSLPRARVIFDEESETTDMFLRASPRDSEGTFAGDDVQGVVRSVPRAQLSQPPASNDLDDLESFAEPNKLLPREQVNATEDQLNFPPSATTSSTTSAS
jgi:hypothetical protein